MQRKTMFYQWFVNWIKRSVIIDFSTEHNSTSFTVNFNIFFIFYFLSIWSTAALITFDTFDITNIIEDSLNSWCFSFIKIISTTIQVVSLYVFAIYITLNMILSDKLLGLKQIRILLASQTSFQSPEMSGREWWMNMKMCF